MTGLSPAVGDMFVIPMVRTKQTTIDKADAMVMRVPFNCRVIYGQAVVQEIGGTTVHTDIDVMVENGTADIFAAEIPCVNGSTITTGSSAIAEPGSAALAKLAEGDVLHLDINITGGASPTAEGVGCLLYCVRE